MFPDLSQRCQVLASDHAHQVGYEYNELSSLLEAAATCEDDLAAVIVSAFDYRYSRQAFILDAIFYHIRVLAYRWLRRLFLVSTMFRDMELPTEEFAKGVRALCDRTGALLIVDDVRAGFR